MLDDRSHNGESGVSAAPVVPREAAEQWWNPERAALHGWLVRRASHLAPLYLAAVRMAMDEGFPGRVHFIAHAIREINNRLPDALDGALQRPKSKYPSHVEKVRQRWVDEGFPADGTGPSLDKPPEAVPGRTGFAVSSEFIVEVGRLVAHHIELESVREALKVPRFEILAGAGPHPRYVWNDWRRATRSAEQFAHARDKELPPTADREWTDNFLAFERFLIVVSKRSYETIADIDDLLQEANSR